MLARRLAERRAMGGEVLDLTESNPTRAGLLCPPDVLALLADERGRRYEPVPAGLAAAREAVAADYARRGVAVDPGRIVLTASTSEAYALLFKLLCDPGDDVLVPRPSYPLFEYLARLESVHVRPLPAAPTTANGTWPSTPWPRRVHGAHARRGRGQPEQPDRVVPEARGGASGCARLCAARGRGHRLRRGVRGLRAAARTRGARRAWPRTRPALDLLRWAGCPSPAACPSSSWPGSPSPAREPRATRRCARLELVADTYLSVSDARAARGSGAAGPRARSCRRPIARPGRGQPGASCAALAAGTPATLLDVGGRLVGGAARARPRAATRSGRSRLLERDGVLVHPGYFFDFPREAFLVLSLLPSRRRFAEGVRRLLARVEAVAEPARV